MPTTSRKTQNLKPEKAEKHQYVMNRTIRYLGETYKKGEVVNLDRHTLKKFLLNNYITG